MPEFNFIKNFTLFNFGSDKRIEVVGGEGSKGVIVLSSQLDANAIKLSNKLTNQPRSKFKLLKRS